MYPCLNMNLYVHTHKCRTEKLILKALGAPVTDKTIWTEEICGILQ